MTMNNSYECRRKSTTVESLLVWFKDHHNTCQVVCTGPLSEALKLTFDDNGSTEDRSLLIYIYDKKSCWCSMLCSCICHSTIILDYLWKNYIIWPWCITDDLNTNSLIELWRKLFLREFPVDLSIVKCPILIGITRRPLERKNSSLVSSYLFDVLLEGNNLTHTRQKLSKALFNTLFQFKRKFDEHSTNFVLSLIKKTGLSMDVVLEITEYLSLNDAIAIFSFDILPVLRKYRKKLQIIEPSEQFIQILMSKHINHNDIVSLRLNENQLASIVKSVSSSVFINTKFITIINLQRHVNQLTHFRMYFMSLTCLSLWYEREIDFHHLCKAVNSLQNPIKRLEIHGNHIRCSHRRKTYAFATVPKLDCDVEYFLLEITHQYMTNTNGCVEHKSDCLLMLIIDFIRIFQEVRSFRLIINNISLQKLLHMKEWHYLGTLCKKLQKITLKTNRRNSFDTQTANDISHIHEALSHIRRDIQFRVIS